MYKFKAVGGGGLQSSQKFKVVIEVWVYNILGFYSNIFFCLIVMCLHFFVLFIFCILFN